MLIIKTALTAELDHIDGAVDDIVAQLDLDSLPPNRLGILTCTLEFIQEGIARAVCDRLSFDVIGCNTTTGAVNGAAGVNQLSLMVLAADDVHFSTALSEPFDDDHLPRLQEMCDAARAALGREPVFALTCSPMLFNFDDGRFVSMFDDALAGVPLFGTMACHYDGEYHHTMSIHNGMHYEDRAVVAFLGGNIQPRFCATSLPACRILRQKAVITRARDNVLMEINNIPVISYMESQGLVQDGRVDGLHAIPFILDYDDDREIAETRTIMGVSPEGHLICGGEMPVGVALALGAQDVEAVVDTARQCLKRLSSDPAPAGMLLFSCHSRCLALGLDNLAEIHEVERALGSTVPYLLAYSGGEICPRIKPGVGCVNFSYCNTLVACSFAEKD